MGSLPRDHPQPPYPSAAPVAVTPGRKFRGSDCDFSLSCHSGGVSAATLSNMLEAIKSDVLCSDKAGDLHFSKSNSASVIRHGGSPPPLSDSAQLLREILQGRQEGHTELLSQLINGGTPPTDRERERSGGDSEKRNRVETIISNMRGTSPVNGCKKRPQALVTGSPQRPMSPDRKSSRGPKVIDRGPPTLRLPTTTPLYSKHSFHPSFFMSPFDTPKESVPEQNEALSLVVRKGEALSLKKKRQKKVTDSRIPPRPGSHTPDIKPSRPSSTNYPPPGLLPLTLPTSVAIPNPSLHQSEVLSATSPFAAASINVPSEAASPRLPSGHDSPIDAYYRDLKRDSPRSPTSDGPYSTGGGSGTPFFKYATTLTPMHLRKAKLMEFFYIQMEKYARQALSEGITSPENLHVTTESELFRVLNLHYNRNNALQVPDMFLYVAEQALREFFVSIKEGRDAEPSWKKAIYKVIARLDDSVPEYFRSASFLEHLESQHSGSSIKADMGLNPAASLENFRSHFLSVVPTSVL
ncbi:unnamed protein product [Cyprideis torosa]|uniref:Uncharacterized protein n=1 Tax=Cyprideis torosa TaxID=163714 RepID=A0A7R8W6P2_9CRUS|nr:unnamed protein product [Cyprideis torosa]CAG0881527.1 unnamed protein product [Cyprideis torosa]